ncbi:hypothetical protein GCM10010319_13410 [Streptomyces blastmyceticus]|uniref:Molecular chaperone DnaJ n=1 Tax=Streptomyces blastmyceticus TaxID=68180 RepID=A0ABP3G875_9ACTN
MSEECCPGPHHFCKGCRGSGYYQALTLYVSQSCQAGEMSAAHTCTACKGRGFFCRRFPPCEDEHEDDTPAIGPDVVPPV